AHFLVAYPEVQENVRAEVQQLLAADGQFDYNSLSTLSYMSQVINESMRFYPPVTAFVTRTSKEAFKFGNITIPAYSTVRIPAYQLHHNEEYWPNHDQFDPERFANKANIDPVVFQPFGTGPR